MTQTRTAKQRLLLPAQIEVNYPQVQRKWSHTGRHRHHLLKTKAVTKSAPVKIIANEQKVIRLPFN